MLRIKYLPLLFAYFISKSSCAQSEFEIYRVDGSDSTLTTKFIDAVCHAVISQAKTDNRYDLELLIIKAANHLESDSAKTMKWHNRFGNQCICPANDNFAEMNFLRLVVASNFRGFANLIGPRNRLPLDFDLKDSRDSLNIYDFVNTSRKSIEAKFNDKRFEFQQDEEWRNMMFFYFLFSEFYLKHYEIKD